jgi:hypothetical protein
MRGREVRERLRLTNKPSQFDDPALDLLLSIVLSLGNEVYIMRDRMRIIEKLLEANGTISRADIERYRPAPDEEESLRREADAFISRLFRVFEANTMNNQ